MTTIWFMVLVLYGIFAGFQNIPVMAWLLLAPFAARDLRAGMRNNRIDKHSRAIALLIEASVQPKDSTLEAAIDAGIVGSLMAQGPQNHKNGMSSAAVGISMTDELKVELQRRADSEGKTTEEMMIELLSQRLRIRGIGLESARTVQRPDDL